MATIYRTDGSEEQVEPKQGRIFTGDELRQIVGGWFEMAGLSDGRVMVCNEEGKLDGLPFNDAATALFNQGGRMFYDPIAGDVLVCKVRELE